MKRNKKSKKLIFIFLLMFFNYCENANREKENRNVEEAIFPLISCTDRMECQDGIWCNGIEYCGCFGGICGRCLPGYPQNCDDGNPCTVDNCINDYVGKAGRTGVPGEFGTGHCEHRQICQYCVIDSDCFDNDKCTDDLCVGNICQNTPKNCNDNDFCTIDSCDDSTGDCVHQRIPDCCHTDADCNDGYECTVDRCNTAIHICSHTANVGANCSYPDECFDPGICMSDGLCHPGAQRVPSNDTCSGALPVTISDIGEGCVEGSTLCARHDYSSSCGGGGSPDVMYSFSFEVGNAFQLYAYNIILDADYNSVLYAQSSCGVSSTMIACNDNCVSSTLLDCTAYNLGRYDSAIVLPPYPVGSRKTIYLGVDGMAGSKGDFKLQIHRVNHRNNPCWYASDTPRRVDATQGGEYRGNINGYINDLMDSSLRWMKTPCHKVTSGAGSDWPGNAWFVLNPASTTTYCVWTDETAAVGWADTVITLIDNTVPSGGGCGGLKRYLGCAHLNGQNGPANPTKMQITVPGGSTYMIGISSFDRPSSGNYRVKFDLGACP